MGSNAFSYSSQQFALAIYSTRQCNDSRGQNRERIRNLHIRCPSALNEGGPGLKKTPHVWTYSTCNGRQSMVIHSKIAVDVINDHPIIEAGPSLLDVKEGHRGENARKPSMVRSLFSFHPLSLSLPFFSENLDANEGKSA